MLTTILSKLSGWVYVVITLVVLCGGLIWWNTTLRESIINLEKDKTSLVEKVERIEQSNTFLKTELDKQPNEYIRIVKESCREIEKGKELIGNIDKLPSTRIYTEVKEDEVDINSRLPADLIRMLDQF